MENFEIKEIETVDNKISYVNWVYTYSDDDVSNYTIAGTFHCDEHELNLDSSITTNNELLSIIAEKLQIENFKQIVFADLGK